MTDSGFGNDPATSTPVFREVYFPTLIYYQDIPEFGDLNQQLLNAVRMERDMDSEGLARSNEPRLGGWHSKNELHRNPAFAALTDKIMAFSREVSKTQGYDPAWPLAIDNMWSIVNPRGSHNKTHIHPNSLWSGVYYIQTPPGAGRICFTDPRTQHLMQAQRYDPNTARTSDNWAEVFFEPTPGRILLFPSWLYHSVETNLTDATGDASDRVIISFNMYQSRGL
ncbi:TIGR02466 family protein [Puniceibacterium sediminis]|uniref:2OG-Fe(II) oxygenase n=1 Tax=Puniceibacterium sediminis TaxID=1608407 RepID=A0A238Z975_9RHOB|nr:TIGR02466 family protein [Puniceibacterium sediminis]SNR79840.1 conserved hypothetical protein [Puniceibacterium sediminis]